MDAKKLAGMFAGWLPMDSPERARNFANMFDGSKLVDDSGKHMTLYHGTPDANFVEFRGGGGGKSERTTAHWNTFLGDHFTEEPWVASRFAEGLYKEPTAGAVYPVNVALKNPYPGGFESIAAAQKDLPALQARHDELYRLQQASMPSPEELIRMADEKGMDLVDFFMAHKSPYDDEISSVSAALSKVRKASQKSNAYLTEDELNNKAFEFGKSSGILPQSVQDISVMNEKQKRKLGAAFRKHLEEQGYDGISYLNSSEKEGFGSKTHIVFDPRKIKSIFNRGTYDPNDPNILKAALPFAAGAGLMSAMAPSDAAARIRAMDAPIEEAWNPVEAFATGLPGGIKAAAMGILPDGAMDWAFNKIGGLMSGGK